MNAIKNIKNALIPQFYNNLKDSQQINQILNIKHFKKNNKVKYMNQKFKIVISKIYPNFKNNSTVLDNPQSKNSYKIFIIII